LRQTATGAGIDVIRRLLVVFTVAVVIDCPWQLVQSSLLSLGLFAEHAAPSAAGRRYRSNSADADSSADHLPRRCAVAAV
jgi:hypothetical protein